MEMKLEKQLIGEELIKHLRYDAETGELFWNHKRAKNTDLSKRAGSNDGKGYLVIGITDDNGKQWYFRAHILVWRIVTGSWPNMQLDHKNRVRNDNRISNLRLVTQQQNLMNQGVRSTNQLGYQNIRLNSNSYRVEVYLQGKFITTKSFPSLSEAIAHRDAIRAEYGFPPATDRPTTIAAE